MGRFIELRWAWTAAQKQSQLAGETGGARVFVSLYTAHLQLAIIPGWGQTWPPACHTACHLDWLDRSLLPKS